MTKKLVLNVDDLGLHRDIVTGVEVLYEQRSIATVSVLSTSGILDETLEGLKRIGIPVGVHLILDGDKPILEPEKIPSLVNEQGCMLQDVREIKKRAKPGDVFNELSAQIENIQKRGVRISHLDSHRALCLLIPALRTVYRELGKKYKVPLALPKHFIFNRTRNCVAGSSDSLNGVYDLEEETLENRIKAYEHILSRFGRGTHYWFSHPCPPTQAIKEAFPDYAIRTNDYALFQSPEWKDLLKKYDVTLSPFTGS